MPRPVELARARHNIVILLHDEEMYERRHTWNEWVSELRDRVGKRRGRDLYVPFGSPTGERPSTRTLPFHIQYQRRKT